MLVAQFQSDEFYQFGFHMQTTYDTEILTSQLKKK